MSESLKHRIFEACVISALVVSIIVISGCITPYPEAKKDIIYNFSNSSVFSTNQNISNYSMFFVKNNVSGTASVIIHSKNKNMSNPDYIELFNNATIILHENNTIEYR